MNRCEDGSSHQRARAHINFHHVSHMASLLLCIRADLPLYSAHSTNLKIKNVEMEQNKASDSKEVNRESSYIILMHGTLFLSNGAGMMITQPALKRITQQNPIIDEVKNEIQNCRSIKSFIDFANKDIPDDMQQLRVASRSHGLREQDSKAFLSGGMQPGIPWARTSRRRSLQKDARQSRDIMDQARTANARIATLPRPKRAQAPRQRRVTGV